LTTAYDIVGLGSYGTTVVAGTMGNPFVASGSSPESMIEERIEVNLPCINARSVVDLGYSVAYASNDGLVVVGNGGASLFTDALFTRPGWQRFSPSTLIAGQFSGRYFASYEYLDLEGKPTSGTLIIDLTNQQPFILRSSKKFDAFFYNLETGQLFTLIGNKVYEWDALGQTNDVMTWKSKRVVLPQPASMGAILIEGRELLSPDEIFARNEELAATIAFNEALLASDSMGSEIDGSEINEFGMNSDSLIPLPLDKFISVSVYADGELIRVVTDINKVKRINGNKRAKIWEIKVSGTAEIEQITMATTVRELNEL
jgi:hypothetical protein